MVCHAIILSDSYGMSCHNVDTLTRHTVKCDVRGLILSPQLDTEGFHSSIFLLLTEIAEVKHQKRT